MTQLASMGGDTAADNEGGTRRSDRRPDAVRARDARRGCSTPEELRLVDAWWRAANYLAVGQIYLMANPLLREPLQAEHVKPRLLGHFGTVPGLNLAYVHANRRSRPATSTPSSSPVPATAAPARTRAPGSRAPTPSSTATSPVTSAG